MTKIDDEMWTAFRSSAYSSDPNAILKPLVESAKKHAIEFAQWLALLDNGTERYNPISKETSESFGFSPSDCFADDMPVEELYERWLKENGITESK